MFFFDKKRSPIFVQNLMYETFFDIIKIFKNDTVLFYDMKRLNQIIFNLLYNVSFSVATEG